MNDDKPPSGGGEARAEKHPTGAPAVRKEDRAGALYQVTRSVCPECLAPIDAQIIQRDGRLVMRKWCREHGWFEALVAPDAARHHAQRRFNKPGTVPLHFEREFHGCPDSCGLCPEHQQHTCLGIIDIIDRCNLSCPVCFADARPDGRMLSPDQVGAMLDRFLRCEGDPEVLQLSGGEPTLHPQLVEILALAKRKGLRKILLNTNGLRLAEDDDLLDRLVESDPTIYLQFDGFAPETYRRLRGRDLSALKLRVLERAARRGLRIVLVATVVRGVNEHELGAIVDLALGHEQITCVNFQPATWAGRFDGSTGNDRDPLDRVTLPEIAERIAAQSKHGLKAEDFFPIPCPDPSCSLATYIHNANGVVRPLPRLINIEDYLDYLKNVSAPELTQPLRRALESLFSMSAVPGEKTTRSFCEACGISLDWGEIEREITMVSAMHFMDASNFDLARAQKCCVHQILPDDGGIVPFCVYNVLHRGRS
ncbi:MAG: radical SAM protein [Deltaproteobacteria bacterium]|nr:radical SAM protein [Deltaproteobacteria bacterium]